MLRSNLSRAEPFDRVMENVLELGRTMAYTKLLQAKQ